jgi:GPH family glycoside/pentoside/hexuronide:cation symporter
MLVYFCQYNLGNVKLVSIFNIVIIGCSILAITSIPWIVSKIGKKNATIIGFTVSAIADLINFALPTNIYTFLPLAVISFMAVSIPGGIVYAMVADAMDFGEWKTGKKAGATVYAAFNFSKKIAQSISGLAAGVGLALTGYIPNVAQTSEALWGIKGLFMAFPAVTLLLASALLYFFYELSDTRCREIAADLQQRKATAGV